MQVSTNLMSMRLPQSIRFFWLALMAPGHVSVRCSSTSKAYLLVLHVCSECGCEPLHCSLPTTALQYAMPSLQCRKGRFSCASCQPSSLLVLLSGSCMSHCNAASLDESQAEFSV